MEVLGQVQGNAGTIGAAWGLLHRGSRVAPEKIRDALLGNLNAATLANHDKTGFIYGILRTCRELSWRADWFLQALDDLWRTWDDDEFARRLPDLRLAFAGLTPSETDHVAECAARLHGAMDLGDLVVREVTEADVERHLAITELVKRSLAEDGLGAWLAVWSGKEEGAV